MLKRRSERIGEQSKRKKLNNGDLKVVTSYYNSEDENESMLNNITEIHKGVNHGYDITFNRQGHEFEGGHTMISYRKGLRQGTCMVWNSQGKLVETTSYINDVKSGPYNKYYHLENSSISWNIIKGEHLNGVAVGIWYYTDNKGKLTDIKRSTEHGEVDGMQTHWGENNVKTIMCYKNGQLVDTPHYLLSVDIPDPVPETQPLEGVPTTPMLPMSPGYYHPFGGFKGVTFTTSLPDTRLSSPVKTFGFGSTGINVINPFSSNSKIVSYKPLPVFGKTTSSLSSAVGYSSTKSVPSFSFGMKRNVIE
jgi:antitoxin component YwqK of YwqJK toxin-antitoxin module